MFESLVAPTTPSQALLPNTPAQERAKNVLIEAHDNAAIPIPQTAESRLFEIPAGAWMTMVGCYAVFLIALFGAIGGGRATFVIVVSGLYVAMFFGTVRVLLRQGPAQPPSPLSRTSRALPTLYGPLSRGEVYGQMLVVPAAIALFGIAVLILHTCLT